MANEVPGEIKPFTEGVPKAVARLNELVDAINWCVSEIKAINGRLEAALVPLTCGVFGNDPENLTLQRVQIFGLVVKQLGALDCGGSGNDLGGPED